MGKSLVIKGADFSANAIPQEIQGQLPIVNGALTLLSNSPNYGGRINDGRLTRAFSSGNGLYIPYGATVIISGLKQDSNVVGLRFDGCYYSSAEATTENVLGDMHGGSTDIADLFLFNADGSNDSVQFVNNYAAAYFVFGFARGANVNGTIAAESYTIQYEINLA